MMIQHFILSGNIQSTYSMVKGYQTSRGCRGPRPGWGADLARYSSWVPSAHSRPQKIDWPRTLLAVLFSVVPESSGQEFSCMGCETSPILELTLLIGCRIWNILTLDTCKFALLAATAKSGIIHAPNRA